MFLTSELLYVCTFAYFKKIGNIQIFLSKKQYIACKDVLLNA